MKNLWNYFSGKKTVISAILSLIVGFLQTKSMVDPDTAMFVLSLIGLLMGVGIAHKIAKANK